MNYMIKRHIDDLALIYRDMNIVEKKEIDKYLKEVLR